MSQLPKVVMLPDYFIGLPNAIWQNGVLLCSVVILGAEVPPIYTLDNATETEQIWKEFEWINVEQYLYLLKLENLVTCSIW